MRSHRIFFKRYYLSPSNFALVIILFSNPFAYILKYLDIIGCNNFPFNPSCKFAFRFTVQPLSVFENITNILGHLMIGPLKKYRNVHASNVANSLVSKMNNTDSGIHILDFDDFKN